MGRSPGEENWSKKIGKTSHKEKVSVIIPTYARPDLLKRAVRSVAEQSYKEIECIVVDDSALKENEKVIAEFRDPRIRYCSHKERRYASAARNTGIKSSTGEYIAFLDDDDEWVKDKLERQMELFQKTSERVCMIYCWMQYYDKGRSVGSRCPSLRGNIFRETLKSQPIGNASTLLLKRETVEAVGGFDEKLKRGNDGDFIRRVCRVGEVDVVELPLVKYYRNHGHDQITGKTSESIKNAIAAQKDKLVKFETELNYYREERATILWEIGKNSLMLGEYKNFIKYFRKAVEVDIFNLGILRKILKEMMYVIYMRGSGRG